MKHIRLESTREYDLAIFHPAYTDDDINRFTNYLQWVEPRSMEYKKEGIMTFLLFEEEHKEDIAIMVRVEFAPGHPVGFLTPDDARKYRAFLIRYDLFGDVTCVCDAAIYGRREAAGRPMYYRLCLALDMDNLHPEDPSEWMESSFPWAS
jgi:hypothetical protein